MWCSFFFAVLSLKGKKTAFTLAAGTVICPSGHCVNHRVEANIFSIKYDSVSLTDGDIVPLITHTSSRRSATHPGNRYN